jgi:hypothetical protein
MTKKLLATALSLFLLAMFMLPLISSAQNDFVGPPKPGLVPCGNPTQPPCNFAFFILMINEIIKWIISIAGVIFTVVLIWGGFRYMMSQGDSGEQGKAREMLWNTMKGFIIILVSWLIIYTILSMLIPKGSVYEESIFKFIGRGN